MEPVRAHDLHIVALSKDGDETVEELLEKAGIGVGARRGPQAGGKASLALQLRLEEKFRHHHPWPQRGDRGRQGGEAETGS